MEEDNKHEEMKKALCENALETAGEILMFAVIACDLKSHIECTAEYPNGEKWKLSFTKVEDVAPTE